MSKYRNYVTYQMDVYADSPEEAYDLLVGKASDLEGSHGDAEWVLSEMPTNEMELIEE